MRGDRNVIKDVAVGTILQINPKAELAEGDGQLCTVVRVAAWGVDAQLPSGNVVPITWIHLEKTGGKLVWDAAGTKLRPTEEPLKHHP